MKESNEIVILVQDFADRQMLLGILAHHGYEVTVNEVRDAMSTVGTFYYVVAHKVV
jgi:hypothetical protein